MLAKTFSIILALALFASPVRAEPIRVAYSGVSAAGTPLWLAKDAGIFARHGLEADLVTVRSAPLQVSALVSNEVQFVRGSASSMLSAAAQGAKLKILMSLFAERASYDFLVSSSITNPRDLERKKDRGSGLQWPSLEPYHVGAEGNGIGSAKGQHQYSGDWRQHCDRPSSGNGTYRRSRFG